MFDFLFLFRFGVLKKTFFGLNPNHLLFLWVQVLVKFFFEIAHFGRFVLAHWFLIVDRFLFGKVKMIQIEHFGVELSSSVFCKIILVEGVALFSHDFFSLHLIQRFLFSELFKDRRSKNLINVKSFIGSNHYHIGYKILDIRRTFLIKLQV